MRQKFVGTAASTPNIRVADPAYNAGQIYKRIQEGAENQADIMVFPELYLTACTCGDLFLRDTLSRRAKEELDRLVTLFQGMEILTMVGPPWQHDGKLYNMAALFASGKLLGLVPRTYLLSYSEFYEVRHFTSTRHDITMIPWRNDLAPMGTSLLLTCDTMPGLTVVAEVCEDVWIPCPPSIAHTMVGVTMVVNCSTSDEAVGKDTYRESLISGQSARLVCGYVYTNADEGESTQGLAFGSRNIIAEGGACLTVSRRFQNETIYVDMDLGRIISDRRRINAHPMTYDDGYLTVEFTLPERDVMLRRYIDNFPFVPKNRKKRRKRCGEVLSTQAMGLKKRLEHAETTHAMPGISGGLGSTLALLMIARAFDMLGLPREQTLTVTMPCFGTIDRTYQSAYTMTRKLDASLREVDIHASVMQHFSGIEQDMDNHDVTYENGQARERIQVLMDIANQTDGLVVSTGDMSELVLGWVTYNGDHMSIYGVNVSVPKALVYHLVRFYANTCGEEELSTVLLGVLDTPVSPELLPPEDDVIVQKTEDLVGPYELHDFYLYYVLRFGYEPSKIFRVAEHAFEGVYDNATILKWLEIFYRHFFSQQSKRSCLPGDSEVGSVAVSPRGDLRIPSDACGRIWLGELEQLTLD